MRGLPQYGAGRRCGRGRASRGGRGVSRAARGEQQRIRERPDQRRLSAAQIRNRRQQTLVAGRRAAAAGLPRGARFEKASQRTKFVATC